MKNVERYLVWQGPIGLPECCQVVDIHDKLRRVRKLLGRSGKGPRVHLFILINNLHDMKTSVEGDLTL